MADTWIERKYLSLLQSQIDGFEWKTKDVANCRCFECGDSAKKKNKKRGYFFPGKHGYTYTCHNCNVSKSFRKVLEELDYNLYREYRIEVFKESGESRPRTEVSAAPVAPTTLFAPEVPECSLGIPTIAELPSNHFAVEYLRGRKIPEPFLDHIHFTTDFAKFVVSKIPSFGERLRAGESRIVIPFYDQTKTLIAFQGRNFATEGNRYLTIKTHPDNPKVYGLDRYQFNKPGYIVEGPFDSMFLPNCLAASGGDVKSVESLVDKKITTFIVDNQPRNPHVVKQIEDCVARGFQVFVWPSTVKSKDLNDLVEKEGYSIDGVVSLVDNNSFSGQMATMKIMQWKR